MVKNLHASAGDTGLILGCLSMVVVQSLSHVQITPWTVAHQASLSFTISLCLLKFMFIESVMPSSNLILCHPLLLLPSISPSIRLFSNESALLKYWPKYWNLIFIISHSNEYSGLISFRIDCFYFIFFISLLSKALSRVFSSTTVQKHQFFGAQTSLGFSGGAVLGLVA